MSSMNGGWDACACRCDPPCAAALKAEVERLNAQLLRQARENVFIQSTLQAERDQARALYSTACGAMEVQAEELATARARVAELERELDGAIAVGDRQRQLRKDTEEMSYARGRRIAELEAALRKYGQHNKGCRRVGIPAHLTGEVGRTVHDPGPCICGLDAALANPGDGQEGSKS